MMTFRQKYQCKSLCKRILYSLTFFCSKLHCSLQTCVQWHTGCEPLLQREGSGQLRAPGEKVLYIRDRRLRVPFWFLNRDKFDTIFPRFGFRLTTFCSMRPKLSVALLSVVTCFHTRPFLPSNTILNIANAFDSFFFVNFYNQKCSKMLTSAFKI